MCLIRYIICRYFLPFCGLSFSFPDSVLWSTKDSDPDKVQVIYFFSFVACIFGVISKKQLLHSRSQRFTPMLSYKSFIILALIFRCLIHFKLIFIDGVSDRTRSTGCALSITPSSTVAKAQWNMVIVRTAWPRQPLPSILWRYHLTCLLSSLAPPPSLFALHSVFYPLGERRTAVLKTHRLPPQNSERMWSRKIQSSRWGDWICIHLKGNPVHSKVRSRLNNLNFQMGIEILFTRRLTWIATS